MEGCGGGQDAGQRLHADRRKGGQDGGQEEKFAVEDSASSGSFVFKGEVFSGKYARTFDKSEGKAMVQGAWREKRMLGQTL